MGLIGSINGLMGNSASDASSSPAEDISIVVGDTAISGWTKIRISRGLQRLPMDFDIEMTENYPGTVNVDVRPGQACQIFSGNDILLTGYIDKWVGSIDGENHTIRVTGRSKCMDLVDCSIQIPPFSYSGMTAADVIGAICSQYNIPVAVVVDKTVSKNFMELVFPSFIVNMGQTPYSKIDEICKWAGFLFYDDALGQLVVAQNIGKINPNNAIATIYNGFKRISGKQSGSLQIGGFSEGVNIQSARVTFSADQRYKTYVSSTQLMSSMAEQGGGRFAFATITDPNNDKNEFVRSIRTKYITMENGGLQDIGERRAIWEVNRRYGRSYQVEIVTDSWYDANGNFYTPNQIANVNIPSLKINNANYVIGETSFLRDEDGGTSCRLTLYPPEAYSVEPIVVNAVAPDLITKSPIPVKAPDSQIPPAVVNSVFPTAPLLTDTITFPSAGLIK